MSTISQAKQTLFISEAPYQQVVLFIYQCSIMKCLNKLLFFCALKNCYAKCSKQTVQCFAQLLKYDRAVSRDFPKRSTSIRFVDDLRRCAAITSMEAARGVRERMSNRAKPILQK